MKKNVKPTLLGKLAALELELAEVHKLVGFAKKCRFKETSFSLWVWAVDTERRLARLKKKAGVKK